jgi:hypothetical protein
MTRMTRMTRMSRITRMIHMTASTASTSEPVILSAAKDHNVAILRSAPDDGVSAESRSFAALRMTALRMTALRIDRARD